MLQLKHNYFIDSDGSCLKLCKRAVRHDDEANTDREVVSLVGYHTDLSTALRSYIRSVVNELDEEVQGYGA